MLKKSLAVAVVVAGGLLVGTPATAQLERRVELSYYIANDGRGNLIANTPPDRWGIVAWQRCLPGAQTCEPVPEAPEGDQTLHAGDDPPGTTYIATATGDGTTIAARSGPYQGRLHPIRLPGVVGRLRVGSLVKPVPAQWAGGWGGEPPFLQLQVCRERLSRTCEVISSTGYWDVCPGTGAVLAPRYRRWFVRVADERSARVPILLAFAVMRPQTLRPLVPRGNVATQFLGRIARTKAKPVHHVSKACRTGHI